jgi:deoxyuridine 5'-triphosphate nucleotidohydrolase
MNATLVFPLSEKKQIVQYPEDFVRLEFKLIDPEARVPYRKRDTDSGYDVYSIEDVTIKPHSTENIRTGIIVACPAGWYYTVEGRSSMWIAGVAPFHGIIDATYTGPLFVRLFNMSDAEYCIKKHDRVAQIILHKAYNAAFVEVEEFSTTHNQRGAAGFGSSGR